MALSNSPGGRAQGASLWIKDRSRAHKSSQFYSALLEQHDPSLGSNHQARDNSKRIGTLKQKEGKQLPALEMAPGQTPVPFSDCHQSFRRFGANVVTTFSMR